MPKLNPGESAILDLESGAIRIISGKGLEPEEEMASKCPMRFMEDNDWSEFAKYFLFKNRDMDGWRWKIPDDEKREDTINGIFGIASSPLLSYYQKSGILCWILSSTLKEIPGMDASAFLCGPAWVH